MQRKERGFGGSVSFAHSNPSQRLHRPATQNSHSSGPSHSARRGRPAPLSPFGFALVGKKWQILTDQGVVFLTFASFAALVSKIKGIFADHGSHFKGKKV